ncbi:hypothetical protein NBRC111894_3510 [Sporolactobacillus inulinus]|uniref:Uncharacterized protein n=1 Tax=Sporolactobacillus inulinus TaxID=2078 RepID=A0A4Y1ZFL5_9BACL|nr:hypothetical protein [Sporolactobacillus inulinus]GAY77956.1 hypothetical protein NBRC111894_3510 [Sporolactobacillus inulinus]
MKEKRKGFYCGEVIETWGTIAEFAEEHGLMRNFQGKAIEIIFVKIVHVEKRKKNDENEKDRLSADLKSLLASMPPPSWDIDTVNFERFVNACEQNDADKSDDEDLPF